MYFISVFSVSIHKCFVVAGRKYYGRLLFLLATTVAVSLLTGFNARAQTLNLGTNDAAAKGIANTYVDFATGIANYSVPLIKAKQQGNDFLVSLAYAAKGVKVSDRASSVGLGWCLTGTGAVTRSVRGDIADESYNGSKRGLITSARPPFNGSDPTSDAYQKEVNGRRLDGENDLFSADYGDLHVKFIIKPDGANGIMAVPLEKTNIKIEITATTPNSDKPIASFKIIDEHGVVYVFDRIEYLYNYYKQSAAIASDSYMKGVAIAWYLSKVQYINGSTASFVYADELASEMDVSYDQTRVFYGQVLHKLAKDPALWAEIQQLIGSSSQNATILAGLNEMIQIYDQRQKSIEMAFRNAYSSSISFNSSADYSSVDLSESFPPGYYTSLEQEFRNNKDLLSFYTNDFATKAYNQQWLSQDIASKMVAYLTSIGYENYEAQNNCVGSFIKKKLLRKIVLDKSVIIFKYAPVAYMPGNYHTFLTQLYQIDDVCDTVTNIFFDYTKIFGVSTGHNPAGFLRKVRFMSKNFEDSLTYRFEYYNEPEGTIPYNYYAQDYWGFYNGANNQSLFMSDPYYYPYYTGAPDDLALFQTFRTYPQYPVTYNLTDGLGSDRIPNPEKVMAYSLKKVYIPTGGNIEFIYEANNIGFNYGSKQYNVVVGGQRIKSIRQNDGFGHATALDYKYEFPAYNNQQVSLSTGRWLKFNRQTFSLAVNYAYLFSDVIWASRPYDFSAMLSPAGNENVYYYYVEESRSGEGTTGYRYLHFDQDGDVYPAYPYWLEGVLLAKVMYDNNGKMVSLDRFQYQADNADVADFAQDNLLINSAWYFSASSQYPFNTVFSQYRPFPYYYDSSACRNAYPNVNQPINIYIGPNVGMTTNPYYAFYQPNILPRLRINDPVFPYRIKVGGKALIKEKQHYTFPITAAVPSNTAVAWQSERPDNFEWLLQAGYGPMTIEKTNYYYDNPGHTYPTRIEVNGGATRTMTKFKYVKDYTASAAPWMAGLQAANVMAKVIEEQKWRYDASAAAWAVAGGRVSTSIAIIQNEASRFLDDKVYATELDRTLYPGQAGWAEALAPAYPYTAVFHEGSQLYKVQEENDWGVFTWGVALTKNARYGGRSRNVYCRDQVNANEIAVVKNTNPDQVQCFDFSWSNQLKQKDYAYMVFKQPVTDLGTALGATPDYNYINYFRALNKVLDRAMQDPTTDWHLNNARTQPLVIALCRSVSSIANRATYWEFKPLAKEFRTQFETLNPDTSSIITTGLMPYFSDLSTLLANLYIFYINIDLFDGLGDYSIIYDENVAYSMGLLTTHEFKINLAKYKESGTNVSFNTAAAGTVSYKVVYQNGTSSNWLSLNINTPVNAIFRGNLALSAIPDLANAKELQLMINDGVAGLEHILVAPENSQFEARSYNGDGSLKFVYNQNGERVNYFYDGFKRMSATTDKQGKVLEVFRYKRQPVN